MTAEPQYFLMNPKLKTAHIVAPDAGNGSYCGKPMGVTAVVVGSLADGQAVCKACAKLVPTTTESDTVTTKKQKPAQPAPVEFTDAEATEADPVAKEATIEELVSAIYGDAADMKRALASGDELLANEHASQAYARVALLGTDNPEQTEALKGVIRAALDTKPAVSGTVVKRSDTDFTAIEGVTELVELGAKQVREGVQFGLKMASTSESVARIMLDVRTRIVDPKTGLPDLMSKTAVAKAAASHIYTVAREGMDVDDVDGQQAHAALAKSVQNRMSDVLVQYLSAFDTTDDTTVLDELFPKALMLLEDSKKAGNPITPSAAIRSIYARKGVNLPTRGRTEIERERNQRKRLDKKRAELEAVLDAPDDERDDDLLDKLSDEVKALESILPNSEPAPEKTVLIRSAEKLIKADDLVIAATKQAAKMTPAEREDLKKRIDAHVTAVLNAVKEAGL